MVFSAIAEAWRMDFYGSWFRAEKLGHVNPEQFLSSYALYLIQYPGLMAHWDSHKEFQNDVRESYGGTMGDFELRVDEVLEQLMGPARIEK